MKINIIYSSFWFGNKEITLTDVDSYKIENGFLHVIYKDGRDDYFAVELNNQKLSIVTCLEKNPI